MSIPLVAVAIIVIVVSFVWAKPGAPLDPEEPTPSPTSTPASTPTQTPFETPEAAKTPQPTTTSNSNNNSGWTYPGSTVLDNGGILVLSSTDGTDKITDWYRNKIESLGFNVKTSVKTSANDVINNVVKAAKNKESISVEITKNPGDVSARIEVEAKSL